MTQTEREQLANDGFCLDCEQPLGLCICEPADFGIVIDPQEICDDLGINYDPRQWVQQ